MGKHGSYLDVAIATIFVSVTRDKFVAKIFSQCKSASTFKNCYNWLSIEFMVQIIMYSFFENIIEHAHWQFCTEQKIRTSAIFS